MTRTTVYDDAVPFVAQPSSLDYDMGRNIDWDNAGGATSIPAGTAMSILASGEICPYANRPATEAALGLLVASANSDDRSGYAGHGLIIAGSIFENLLPDFAGGSWVAITGDLSTAFHWLTYEDDR